MKNLAHDQQPQHCFSSGNGIHRSAGDRGSADQHRQATRTSAGTTSSQPDGVSSSRPDAKQESVKRYYCDLCSFSAIYPNRLKQDLHTHCVDVVKLSCLVCLQAYPDMESLTITARCMPERRGTSAPCVRTRLSWPRVLNITHSHTHGCEDICLQHVSKHVPRIDTLKRHINIVHLGKYARKKKEKKIGCNS